MATQPIKVFDPVTVRWFSRGSNGFRTGHVVSVEQFHIEIRLTNQTDPLVSEMLFDEGETWIRGHHAPDSPEAIAIVVAEALSR